ncbi:polymorphic toxin-type HINT domain-containing protein, partial [Saccharothrix sp. CB00851]|uniref:polymorphic toxin-type HINT domain-containing protein n=2 Tax=Saccharothrix TaxID=2071 RepID=UPI000B05395C
GYAYANNSPVTYSDPTGLIIDCGPDGVLCGRNPAVHGEGANDTYERERTTFYDRQRAWQQSNSGNDTALKNRLATEGIAWEDYQRALADAHKTKWDVIKEVAWEVLKEISGWNDIVDCFTKGDIWGCAGLVAGLVPWGKAAKVLEAGYNALKAVGRLAGIVDKAKGVLRRVQTITDDITRAATEKFQKLVSGCAAGKHSFVATTLVLMADGSTKPISEVEIGDKVKATDPTTGETADRAVVATIVHTDEDDMTRLTVTNADGTTGTVDATSWHPVWVEDQRSFVNIGDLDPGDRLTSADSSSPRVAGVDHHTRFEPVHDLTVEGVHTYYVLAGTMSILVHNTGGSGHICDITAIAPDGSTRVDVKLESGDMTPEEATLGYPNDVAFTHTEHRFSRMAGASTGSKVSLPNDPFVGQHSLSSGDTVTMRGQLPPCSRCKGAMNRMVGELGVSVTYEWSGPKGAGTWVAGRRR